MITDLDFQAPSVSDCSTSRLISVLKEAGQDHEFYPTTDEIIRCLVADVEARSESRLYSWDDRKLTSVLDIGAGSGKVLRAFRDLGKFTTLYAIEKSPILCQRLDSEIFIVGTDFWEQSLLSKQMDVIFCNPPYSEFVGWAAKIIREAGSKVVYLVIPTRWEGRTEISEALKHRDAEATVIGTFDFENAEDRRARAVVNLLRVEFKGDKDDAFDRLFDEQFKELNAKFSGKKKGGDEGDNEPERIGADNRAKMFSALVPGGRYPERMVSLYNDEMDHLRKNYDLVGQLDVSLLKEFDVTPKRVLECLKARLKGLRNAYWNELFGQMSIVTNRLASKKRRKMLELLQRHAEIDFTVSNIEAVIGFILKNANKHIDEQLVEVFEQMIEKANVYNYKSNQKPFVEDRWRYSEEKPTHIALEFRLVVEHTGGLRHSYEFEKGLQENAAHFIGDLLTVANNLGFLCNTVDPRLAGRGDTGIKSWESGKVETFYMTGKDAGQPVLEVRAFLNGNIHIRMNQKLALALNVEYGRLKGWLGNGAEAAEELGDKNAAAFFGNNLQIGAGNLPMLMG